MLELITFKPSLGCRAPSPPSVKADALLAMSGLAYKRVYGDVRKAPRKKLPVLKDGDRLIPDSAHIQHYLETEKGIDFDGSLTPQQLAVSTAFRRLIEEHFYIINAHFRWNDHSDAVKQEFFGEVPGLMRGFIFRMVLKNLNKTHYLQGLGRHTRDELIRIGREDVDAIATQLGDQKFFHGDNPTSIDASLYGALHNLVDNNLDTPIKAACMKHKNLVDYCARFAATVFKD